MNKSPEGCYKRTMNLYTHSPGAQWRSFERSIESGTMALDGGLLGPFRQHQSRNAVFWLVNFAALYEKYGGNGVLPLRGSARYTVSFLHVNPVRKRYVVNSFPMLAHAAVPSCACHPVAAHPLSDASRCTCAVLIITSYRTIHK